MVVVAAPTAFEVSTAVGEAAAAVTAIGVNVAVVFSTNT